MTTRDSYDLDLYDIACLAGGPDRMVDAALIALVQSGRVRVHRPGQLATVDLSRRHPVEAAVLDAIGPTGHRSIDTIRWRVAGDDRLLDVVHRLQGAGLLGHVHRLVPHRSGGRSSPAATHEGRRALRHLEAEPPVDRVAPGTDAMLVALGGPERLPDQAFSTAIFEEARTVSHFGRGSHSTNRDRGRRGGSVGRPADPPHPAQQGQSAGRHGRWSGPAPAVATSPSIQEGATMRSSGQAPDLEIYDIAFLAGGAERVVDTALVALVESGRVRVHAPGELAVAEPGRGHPVEAAVLDAVGTQGHRSIDTIRWRLADDVRISDLARSLSAAGLLRHRRFGRKDPDGLEWSLTASGREALDGLAEQPPVDRALDGGSSLRVALFGRGAMPDADLRASIFERPLPPLPPAERGAATRRRRRIAEDGDPSLAAYRTRNTAAGYGGAAGFDGGGGGFDGGGG